MPFIHQPFSAHRLGDFILQNLANERWTSFRAAVAFVKRSGTQHIRQPLLHFAGRASVRISAGIAFNSTSIEGLEDLLAATPNGQVWVYHNPGNATFHPKTYLFRNNNQAELLVGSGNLTSGGLFKNYEASLALSLDLNNHADLDLLNSVETVLDGWSQPNPQLCHRLTPALLQQLVDQGYVKSEAQMAASAIHQQPPGTGTHGGAGEQGQGQAAPPPLFVATAVPQPPEVIAEEAAAAEAPVAMAAAKDAAEPEQAPLPALSVAAALQPGMPTFVVSVLSVDLPVPGSSNEVTITKHIRDVQPGFWGWTGQFTGSDPITGQRRRNVRIRYKGGLVNAYLLDFPGRKPDGTKASADFRMGAIAPIVADLQQEDDLVVLSRSNEPDVAYTARVVSVNDPEHEDLMDGMQVYSRSRSAKGTYRKHRYWL